jgi:hypothetical protein
MWAQDAGYSHIRGLRRSHTVKVIREFPA